MTSIFTGVKRLTKSDGTTDSRKLKRRVAENIERLEEKFSNSQMTKSEMRTKIENAIIYLFGMNKYLPNPKPFNFRIELHRHNPSERFTVRFRVGGSGKRYSLGIGFADEVMPVLISMWHEQMVSGATTPLTSRALDDVERIAQDMGLL
jgi:hypothetical protein